MLEDKFIAAYHGGLGDNLQFSTLPEQFAKLGHDVYVPVSAFFRNKEIYELVWKHNPYVKGIKVGNWNVGDTPEIGHRVLSPNCISNWELLHGLKETNTLPKVYYVPTPVLELQNTVIVDLTAISTEYNSEELNKALSDLIEEKYKHFSILKLQYLKNLNPAGVHPYAHNGKHLKYSTLFVDSKIEVSSIFELCNILASAKAYVCLHSGGHALASAMKQHNANLEICCLTTTDAYNTCKAKSIFLFPNVEYKILP